MTNKFLLPKDLKNIPPLKIIIDYSGLSKSTIEKIQSFNLSIPPYDFLQDRTRLSKVDGVIYNLDAINLGQFPTWSATKTSYLNSLQKHLNKVKALDDSYKPHWGQNNVFSAWKYSESLTKKYNKLLAQRQELLELIKAEKKEAAAKAKAEAKLIRDEQIAAQRAIREKAQTETKLMKTIINKLNSGAKITDAEGKLIAKIMPN